jgi:hypothetical protein
MARVIAECAGTELVEDGARLVFVDRSVQGAAIAAFVSGLLTVIATLNSVVQLAQGNAEAALVILLVGALAGLVLWFSLRAIRRKRARPVEELPPLLVLDRSQGVLCDSSGRALAPLSDLTFAPQMQLGSSSSALVCRWPGGEMVVARGSPFLGSIDDLRTALASLGFRA